MNDQTQANNPNDLTVSVIICAHSMDRLTDLGQSIESVRNQSYPADELLVVIDHNDELFEAAREIVGGRAGEILMVNTGPKGLSGARNAGTEAATSEIVAYLDDDAIADSEWLKNLLDPFSDPKVVAVGGWAVPNWDSKAPEWFSDEFSWVIGCSHVGLPTERAEVRNVIGCNMAFRRRAVIDNGGFNEGLGRTATRPLGCEETELCIRIRQDNPALSIVLEPSAIVNHRVGESRGTWKYYVDRCRAEGNSKAFMVGIVGSDEGLDSERHYVTRVLPAALARSLREIPGSPSLGIRKTGAIVGGLAATAGGYAEMKVRSKFGGGQPS